jgi:hypothetical protein
MKRLLQWFGLKSCPCPLPDLASLPLPKPERVHAHHVNTTGDRHFLVVSHPTRAGFKILTLWWDTSDWENAGSAYWVDDDGSSIYADAKLAEDTLLAECASRQLKLMRFDPANPPETRPYLDLGGPGPNNGWLVGNPAGLELLRRKAEEALENGEGRFEHPFVWPAGIRIVHPSPAGARPKKWDQMRDAVGAWGCGLTVAVVLFVLLAGAYQIWTWLR